MKNTAKILAGFIVATGIVGCGINKASDVTTYDYLRARTSLTNVVQCSEKTTPEEFRELVKRLYGAEPMSTSANAPDQIYYTIPNPIRLYGRDIKEFTVTKNSDHTEYRARFYGEPISTIANIANIPIVHTLYVKENPAGKLSLETENGATFIVCRQLHLLK